MAELLQALNDWSIAVALRQPGAAYPLLSATHIFSLGVLVGAITTLDLRLLGLFRGQPLRVLANPLLRMAVIGLALAVTSGFLLFSVRPVEYAANPAFLIKLVLLAMAAVNIAVLHCLPYWKQAQDRALPHASIQAAAAISLLLWPATIVAGRWIGFT